MPKNQIRAIGLGALITGIIGPGIGVAVLEVASFLDPGGYTPSVQQHLQMLFQVVFYAYLFLVAPCAVAGILGALFLQLFSRRSAISHLYGAIAGGILGFCGIWIGFWAIGTSTHDEMTRLALTGLVSGSFCGIILSFFLPLRPDCAKT